jgi:hypothetical protein
MGPIIRKQKKGDQRGGSGGWEIVGIWGIGETVTKRRCVGGNCSSKLHLLATIPDRSRRRQRKEEKSRKQSGGF